MAKPTHVMIDIETLGLSVESAITQIAAVRFHMMPHDFEVADTFDVRVDILSNLQAGRVIDAGTVKWWIDTNPELFIQGLKSENSRPLGSALQNLWEWLRAGDDLTIWANGTEFDISILNHAYRHTYPSGELWAYHKVRDCRTIWRQFGHLLVEPLERRGEAHDALSDALYQAENLNAVLDKLYTSGELPEGWQ